MHSEDKVAIVAGGVATALSSLVTLGIAIAIHDSGCCPNRNAYKEHASTHDCVLKDDAKPLPNKELALPDEIGKEPHSRTTAIKVPEEISTEEYSRISTWCSLQPGLKQLVNYMFQDGLVDADEYAILLARFEVLKKSDPKPKQDLELLVRPRPSN